MHNNNAHHSFNPRPRAGGDSAADGHKICPLCFNPRPRAGGDFIIVQTVQALQSFNPRPRAGGDRGKYGVDCARNVVSIHAPAQGATYIGYLSTIIMHVSIHAPAQGATCLRAEVLNDGKCFNPRPRAGGDTPADVVISFVTLFQSTPPRRGRHTGTCWSIDSSMFQSTPPRRGRPKPIGKKPQGDAFQSTPPRRGRRGHRAFPVPPILFQSTPPRRGRRSVQQ